MVELAPSRSDAEGAIDSGGSALNDRTCGDERRILKAISARCPIGHSSPQVSDVYHLTLDA
jgi:hypothetical protein